MDTPKTESMLKQSEVYSMPKDFVVKQEPSHARMYIILGVVGLLILGVFAVFFLLPVSPEVSQEPAAVVAEIAPIPDAVPPEPEKVVPPPVVAGLLPPGIDQDADGLTDVEEGLFASNSIFEDTDGDGHGDGTEVVNLFNPSGVAPADLEQAIHVRRYVNQQFSYSILYPSLWSVQVVNEDGTRVKFSSSTGEFIDMNIYSNEEQLPVLEWYQKQFSTASADQVEVVTTKNGYKGVRGSDRISLYVVKPLKQTITEKREGSVVYGIEYKAPTAFTLEYATTFQMMVNSFRIFAE